MTTRARARSVAARGWDRPDSSWTAFSRIANPRIDVGSVRKVIERQPYMRDALDQAQTLAWMQGKLDADLAVGAEFWRNNLYLVMKGDAHALGMLPPGMFPPMWWLRVFRRDGKRMRAGHWSTLQRIKNELVGPLHEGVELYPEERRLADGEHSYHLWVFKEPTTRFWFGLPDQLTTPDMPCIPHHCISEGRDELGP